MYLQEFGKLGPGCLCEQAEIEPAAIVDITLRRRPTCQSRYEDFHYKDRGGGGVLGAFLRSLFCAGSECVGDGGQGRSCSRCQQCSGLKMGEWHASARRLGFKRLGGPRLYRERGVEGGLAQDSWWREGIYNYLEASNS